MADRDEDPGTARAGEDRDRALLGQLHRAQSRGDAHGALVAIGELLTPHLETIRGRVANRLSGTGLDQDDIDDVTADVAERLVRVLGNRSDLGGAPFPAVLANAIDWAVLDFQRRRIGRGRRELITDPDELPEAAASAPGALSGWERAGQAGAVSEILSGLSQRECQIVIERAVLSLPPPLVADRHGMTRSALDTAYSRALAKLRREMGGEARQLSHRQEPPARSPRR